MSRTHSIGINQGLPQIEQLDPRYRQSRNIFLIELLRRHMMEKNQSFIEMIFSPNDERISILEDTIRLE